MTLKYLQSQKLVNITTLYDKCWPDPAYMIALGNSEYSEQYQIQGPIPSFDINKARETLPNLVYMYSIDESIAFYETTPDTIPLISSNTIGLSVEILDSLYAQLYLCLKCIGRTWQGQQCYYRRL